MGQVFYLPVTHRNRRLAGKKPGPSKKIPERTFQKVIESSLANYYSKMHSERIKRGLQAKKTQNVQAEND